jgi:hypothetical protein
MNGSPPERCGADDGEYWLTEAQVRQFHEDGYLVLEDVLSEAELAPIETIYDQFVRGEVPGMGRDLAT